MPAKRSHDLNRLLGEPSSGRNGIESLKIPFPVAPAARGIGVTKPDGGDGSRHQQRKDADVLRLRGMLLQGATSAPTGPVDASYFATLRERVPQRSPLR